MAPRAPRSRARRGSGAVPRPEHLQRAEQWHGLRRGDPVDIDGPALRGATWRFLAFVRNERNGTESVEVIGGRPGEDRVRSFRPEQVFPLGGRRAGQASLAEAPRLPLG
ncbi:MAG TPA: hypothetical protein VMB72_05710 [Acidimicrobiales bacterium]|nr:hypothetical protein [Acidimicrobiales bacterium]